MQPVKKLMKTDAAAKMPKRTKWLVRLGVAMLLYTIIGFFVVPAIIKSQMLQRLPALTKRQVAIERVKFNPYVLSLTIDGFSLKETNGDVFSSFGELYVNFQLSSIFKRSWVFDEIRLQDPFAQVTYLKDGTFNFANLISNPSPAPSPAPQAPQPLPPVIVYHLIITNGAVVFADFTRKTLFQIRYQPINVRLTDFTTLRDKTSPYEIIADDDAGESFGWTGNITVNPLRSSGAFRLGEFKLNKYKPYSQDYALFEIVDGQVDASAEYSYDSTTNALDLEITNAAMTLSRFQLKTPDTGEDVLTIPTLSIKQVSASVARRTAEIGQIKSSGGSILVRQSQDGTINFLANLVPQPKETRTNAAPTAGPPWTARIDEIAFDNYAIKAEDKKPAKPAAFNIDQLGFNLKNVSNLSNAPVTVALALRLQDTGWISVNGTATLLPPSADLQIGVSNLDLRMIQPYLDEQVKLALTRGALNVNGHARYMPAAPGAPMVSFAGDVSVRNFAVTDEVLFNDMATWDALEVTGIQADWQPLKLHVDQIKFSRPKNSVIIGPDHRINFMTMLPEKKAAPAETNSPPPANPLPEMTLGAFVFENASLHFADLSLEPNCTFDIQDSSGSFKNISSLVQTPAALDVKGKIDAFSTFSVTGKLNPMPDKLFADIAVAFTNTGLTAFSPYTEKYAGRPLQKGKLSLALHYQINQQALNAENGIFIDQLTLGAKNNSTNATSLPVKLAIALLKDRNGRIKLDVPVQGRLDDPKFRLAPIIWGVIGNLIVKAATSPFSLLGAMFGGGDELSFVAFDPGHADLTVAESQKLDTLAKALYERPTLTLEINGSVDPAKDRPEMARAKFQRQIKALFIKKMTDAGKPPVAMDDLKLEPDDYERLVAKVYRNTFGAYHPADAATPPLSQKPIPAASPVVKNSSSSGHGASRMTFLLHQDGVVEAPRPAPGATLEPASPAQSKLDDMEEQLLQKIEITSDDFRQLMQDRARQVESYLLQSGKVTADRLFITAPKPIDANAKGEGRVNLTLD
jgi:uncharacterized protein involved in outer membrane biogenesis